MRRQEIRIDSCVRIRQPNMYGKKGFLQHVSHSFETNDNGCPSADKSCEHELIESSLDGNQRSFYRRETLGIVAFDCYVRSVFTNCSPAPLHLPLPVVYNRLVNPLDDIREIAINGSPKINFDFRVRCRTKSIQYCGAKKRRPFSDGVNFGNHKKIPRYRKQASCETKEFSESLRNREQERVHTQLFPFSVRLTALYSTKVKNNVTLRLISPATLNIYF